MFLFIYKIFFKFKMLKKKFLLGSNLSIDGFINLNTASNKNGYLSIGKNVTLRNGVEIIIKDNGNITIKDNVVLDSSVRILVAHNAKLIIDSGTKIGKDTILNSGEDMYIGKNCSISSNCSINSSAHQFNLNKRLSINTFKHKKISIGDNVLIGANVVISPGVEIGNDTVVSANIIVKDNLPSHSILKNIQNTKIEKINKK